MGENYSFCEFYSGLYHYSNCAFKDPDSKPDKLDDEPTEGEPKVQDKVEQDVSINLVAAPDTEIVVVVDSLEEQGPTDQVSCPVCGEVFEWFILFPSFILLI